MPGGYHIETEQPMAFRFEPSAPQPDVMILRGRVARTIPRLPHHGRRGLDRRGRRLRSLAADRKLAFTYAAEAIPVYWLLNLPGRRLEVHTEPAEGAYTRITPFGPDEDVPVILDGQRSAASE